MTSAGPMTMLRISLPYMRNEAKVVVADRGLLVVDTVLATLLPLVIQVVLWSAVYGSRDTSHLNGYDYQQLITYFVYATALGRLNNGYDIVERVSHSVLEGTLEAHVVRPLPVPMQMLAGFLGGSTIYLGLIGVALVVDLVWRGGALPISGVELLVHLLVVVVVLLLSQSLIFLLSFCLGLAAFALKRTDLLLSMLLLAQGTLGGLLLPPDIWDGPVRVLMEYNPFRFVLATPAELLSSWQLDAAASALLPGMGYLLLFGALAGWLWHRAQRIYHGAGG